MATVEELQPMMNTLQGQRHASNQDISRLTAENPQFRQAGLAEIATVVGQAVQAAISNANPRSNDRQSFVDMEGRGKLATFKGESERFTEWLRKITGFLTASYGSAFRPVIEGRIGGRRGLCLVYASFQFDGRVVPTGGSG